MKSKKDDVLGSGLENLLGDKERETIDLDAASGPEEIETDFDAEDGAPDNSVPDKSNDDSEQDQEEIQPSTIDLDVDDENAETGSAGLASENNGGVVVEDIEILYSFIEESTDHLESIEEKILHLEKTRDPETIAAIFRSMHTMKGTSSFFGFDRIKELSHSLESLLDDLRNGESELTEEIIDALLAGTDTLSRMIGELSQHAEAAEGGKGPITIPETVYDTREIIERVAGLRAAEGVPGPLPAAAEESGEQAGAPGEPADDSEPDDELITDEIRQNFVTESVDLLDVAEEFILELETTPNDKDSLDGAFRCIHTLKGNAGFLGFGEFEVICMELETVLDAIRNGRKEANERTVSIILNTIDSLRKAIASKGKTTAEAGASAAAEQLRAIEDLAEAYKPLGEVLVEMGAVTPEEVEKALNAQERKLGEILIEEGKVSAETVDQALSKQKLAGKNTEADTVAGSGIERKDIRVDMSKLDKLFDLMGELITAEAMVINNPELQNLEIDSFTRAASYLGKITREMQEITMSVRMIPLEGLFNKMRRLVRDLSKRFGKQINLEVSGQDTEMDRNVIEEIADPLMHIIRNSIDHGIEDSEKREAAGKKAAGTVRLNARYEGNEIWISVQDDGAGLNRDRILAKAAERGITKAEADAIKDEDVWQLIFEPGFSTAEKLSEVSGRGVGMDVVKRNVEKLRGKIDIITETGSGTEFILKIPLTLAIMDGITTRVGQVLYALPLGDILEFHKAEESQLTYTTSTKQVLKLRDEIIPIIKLHEFFNTNTEKTAVTDGICILTQRNGKKAALLVDEIEGYQQIVVKALPEYMGQLKAISGCSILGNGEVTLIIDAGSLLTEEFE